MQLERRVFKGQTVEFLSKLRRWPSSAEMVFAESQEHSSVLGTGALQTPADLKSGSPGVVGIRKQAIQLILKETLHENGIPPGWIAAHVIVARSRERESGLHVRFVIRHWDPRLVEHTLSLQGDFNTRLLLLDPNAVDWLTGYAWQFKPRNEQKCPGLPHPGSWTAVQVSRKPTAAVATILPGGAADVIAGPVTIFAQPAAASPRLDDQPDSELVADLAALMAIRDDDASQKRSFVFAPTEPAPLMAR